MQNKLYLDTNAEWFISSGLTFVQKKVGRGNWLEFTDTDLSIGIAEMERAFIQHFDDRSIQVTGMSMILSRFNYPIICTGFQYENEEG